MARAEGPAELPTLYVPTKGESARNAQRIRAPANVARSEVKAVVEAVRRSSPQISAPSVAPGTA